MFTKYWSVRFLVIWIILWLLTAVGLKSLSPLFVLVIAIFLVDDETFRKQGVGVLIVLSFIEDLFSGYYLGTHFLALGIVLLLIELFKGLLSLNDILKAAVFGSLGYILFFIVVRVIYVISGVSAFSFTEIVPGWYNVLFGMGLYLLLVAFKDVINRKLKL